MRAATVVQVFQDLFYVLLHVLFYLRSLIKHCCGALILAALGDCSERVSVRCGAVSSRRYRDTSGPQISVSRTAVGSAAVRLMTVGYRRCELVTRTTMMTSVGHALLNLVTLHFTSVFASVDTLPGQNYNYYVTSCMSSL